MQGPLDNSCSTPEHTKATHPFQLKNEEPWRRKPAMKKKRVRRKHGEHPIFSCSLNSVKNNKNAFKMCSKIKAFENTKNIENNLILFGKTSFQCFFISNNRKQFLKTSTRPYFLGHIF